MFFHGVFTSALFTLGMEVYSHEMVGKRNETRRWHDEQEIDFQSSEFKYTLWYRRA